MKKLLLFILFFSIYFNNFGQSQGGFNPTLTYWYYRDRLKYFVIPGQNQGECEVMDIRNRLSYGAPPTHSTYGQEQLHFGLYISMLATQWALLHSDDQTDDAAITLNELNNALDQFNTYLDKTTNWNDDGAKTNGFFVRENVPCDFIDTNITLGRKHRDLLNNKLTKYDLWNINPNKQNSFNGLPRGYPGWCDNIDVNKCPEDFESDNSKEAMSQDEVIHVLVGLALVSKLCPSAEKQKSSEIACRIMSWVQNDYSFMKLKFQNPNPMAILPWFIYKPWGLTPIAPGKGGCALMYYYGYCEAAKFFDKTLNGLLPCINYIDIIEQNGLDRYLKPIWKLLRFGVGRNGRSNAMMSSSLAAIGNSWDVEINIKIHYAFIDIPILTIRIPATARGIRNQTRKYYDNNTYYTLLWEVLNNKGTKFLSYERIHEQINGAPCYGPYRYTNPTYHRNPPSHPTLNTPAICAGGGWASTDRWDWTIAHHEGLNENESFLGNFNGLDYMLFYNLYRWASNPKPYKNYMDLHLSGEQTSSETFNAIRSITSNQEIFDPRSDESNISVNYVAGDSIILKPGGSPIGFSVNDGILWDRISKQGNKFHAYLDTVNGCKNAFGPDIPDVYKSRFPSEDSINTSFIIPCLYDNNGVLIPMDHLTLTAPDADTTFTIPGGSPKGTDTTITLGPFFYEWDLGNGNKAYTRSADLYCPSPGTYTVQLIERYDTLEPDTIIFNIIKEDCSNSGCTPVSIVTQPKSQTPCESHDASFDISAYGSPPLSYQWTRNGNPITGATQNNFVLKKIIPNRDAAIYTCIISNRCGSATSTSATLEVATLPVANTVPIKQTKNIGDSVYYDISPIGTGPFTFQWLKNNNIIIGATNYFFKIKSIIPTDSGIYTCIITNKCGTITAQVAILNKDQSRKTSEFNDNSSSINLYPNPNEGAFTIDLQLSNDENVTIEAYNMMGKLVLSENRGMKKGTNKINLSINNGCCGLYMIVVKTVNQTFYRKIMVE